MNSRPRFPARTVLPATLSSTVALAGRLPTRRSRKSSGASRACRTVNCPGRAPSPSTRTTASTSSISPPASGVYDRDLGKYLGKTWSTPDYRNGRPSGLSIDKDDHLLCSDSHYHCIRIYDADGKQLRVLGGEGGSNEARTTTDTSTC